MSKRYQQIQDICVPESYRIEQQEYVAELDSFALLLRHKKSGARVLLFANDDENKVFSIGFRTPPDNSTGIPHIIEHTVLCGSEEFPAKDPFVELVGLFEYLSECHDISGQDTVSGGKLQ